MRGKTMRSKTMMVAATVLLNAAPLILGVLAIINAALLLTGSWAALVWFGVPTLAFLGWVGYEKYKRYRE